MKPELVIADPPASGIVEADPAGRMRNIVKTALLVVSVVLGLFLWWWSEGAEERAIRELPERERRALFLRALENVKSVCQAPESAMQDFCRNQARMVLEFPECDETCQGVAQAQLQPVRSGR
jgi:hypothetical protein